VVKGNEEGRRSTYREILHNFGNKLHLHSIQIANANIISVKNKKSELIKSIEALNVE
jgi:hypothetical protein